MSVDTAVVLCAGKGTRLYPVTLSVPKALVPIANRPMLVRIAEDLFAAGIRRLVIVVSPWDEQTVAYAREHSPDGLEIEGIVQPKPLGLADAVAQTRSAIGDQKFVLYLGDELIDPGAERFVKEAENSGADGAVLLCEVDEPQHFGVAVLNGDRIVRLVEKPPPPCPSNLAVVGIYILPPEIFDAIDATEPSARGEVEITDAIQRLIDEGMDIRGPRHEGVGFDVGRVEPLLAANRYCLEREVPQWQGSELDGCVVEGQVAIGPDCHIENCTIRGPVSIASGCTIRDATIGPHVSVARDCEISDSVLRDCIIGPSCIIRGIRGGLEASVLAEEVSIEGTDADSAISIVAGKRTCLRLRSQ